VLPAGRQNVASVIPDPDTVGDWLRRMGDPQTWHARLVGLGQVRDALTARLLRRDGHETHTLDTNATLVEGGSAMPSGATQGYAGTCRYSVFLWEAPVCLVDECREGNLSPEAPSEAYNPRHRGLWNFYICSWASGGS